MMLKNNSNSLHRVCIRRQVQLRAVSCKATVGTSYTTGCEEAARMFYEEAWSKGKVLLLDKIMSENHEQLDMVWQPQRPGSASGGRRGMKRGILAYRQAYPDLVFKVVTAAATSVGTQDVYGSSCNSNGKGDRNDVSEAAGSPFEVEQHKLSSTSDLESGQGPAEVAEQSRVSEKASEPQPGNEHVTCSVFVHWSATGTNLGPIRNKPPTGQVAAFAGISRLDFDGEGKICRSLVFRQATEGEAAYFMSVSGTPGASVPLAAVQPQQQ